MRWLRYFDLEYWQMREALGYPIPAWVDRRWPRQLAGNAGVNPFRCSSCEVRGRGVTPGPSRWHVEEMQ